MKRCFLAVAPLFLVMAQVGCGEPEVREISFELREMQRYGVDTIPEEGMDARVRSLGGAVLADIAGITADEARVYVLDRDWQKVVVFDRSGALETVVGGPGEGPGEFRLPVHLTLVRPGVISVLDYDLARVSFFSSGGFQEAVTLEAGGMLRHAVVGDTIFVAGHGSDSGPIARLFTREAVELPAPPAQSLDDQEFGSPLFVAPGSTASVLVSTRRPGVWFELGPDGWRRMGEALFPDMSPPVTEQVAPGNMRVTPAQANASGIAETTSGYLLQGYSRFPRPFSWEDPPDRDEMEYRLAVFEGGRHLATLDLPPGITTSCLYADPITNHVFLCSQEPLPQVVEYELEVRNAG